LKNFINAHWLHEHLEDKNIVVVDCRGDLFDSEYGKKVYNDGHIKNAFFIDINKDLSKKTDGHGGRHPLPDIEAFKDKVESMGINDDTFVVAYDEIRIAGAARFLLLLKYIGHEKNYLLDGGIKNWIENGYILETELPIAKKAKHNINLNNDILSDVTEIKEKSGKEGFVVVDSRTPQRYRGEVEPIDKKAGHIPGAKNYFWKESLKSTGEIKEVEELKERYKELEDYQEIVIHCGSGIDAAFNYFLMDEIGLKSKVYIGSWSDWISYEDNEVAIGGEK